MHSNIFRIISYSLYMTTLYEKDLRIICIEGLKRFMDQSIEVYNLYRYKLYIIYIYIYL